MTVEELKKLPPEELVKHFLFGKDKAMADIMTRMLEAELKAHGKIKD